MDLRDKLSNLPANPGKILKIVIGLSFVLLLIWLLTLSHIDSDSGNQRVSELIGTEQVADSVQTTDSTSPSLLPQQSGEESSSMLTDGLVTFFVLLAILALVWFWVDRKGGGTANNDQREISSEVLGEGARMKILKVNNEVWVLGVTSQNVNLLHRYSQDEWTESKAKEQAPAEGFTKLFKSNL